MIKWLVVGIIGYILLNVATHKLVGERERKELYEDARKLRLKRICTPGQHLTEDDITV